MTRIKYIQTPERFVSEWRQQKRKNLYLDLNIDPVGKKAL